MAQRKKPDTYSNNTDARKKLLTETVTKSSGLMGDTARKLIEQQKKRKKLLDSL